MADRWEARKRQRPDSSASETIDMKRLRINSRWAPPLPGRLPRANSPVLPCNRSEPLDTPPAAAAAAPGSAAELLARGGAPAWGTAQLSPPAAYADINSMLARLHMERVAAGVRPAWRGDDDDEDL
ncbi:hypothetical protein EMIHUDRAFT_222594 [Emiliania huxleyi CCMP1516]|nr:hypothetical protein EMIHUDRAFT_222594 [Emiliania huxleyi CCMP1516]EOD40504.1 hypothetical protein EMIHUDRAFT_222594 [Emiliania huxleyi CCMP1516]|eukprot:XP_005792933.1 hypothetical protein EMIHUDRAFT_222594 [Emiliania huxleyi CCMP1516]